MGPQLYRPALHAAFCAVVPAPLATVTAIRLLDDIGILALVTDRSIMFYFDILWLFFHGDLLQGSPIKMCRVLYPYPYTDPYHRYTHNAA